jgi:hypothetical protein
MASFTTRIELTNLPDGDSREIYEALHGEMAEYNFSKEIVSDDGKRYELPDAEYNISGSYNRSEVLNMAKEAISNIGRTGRVLVTESNGRTWSGLKSINS